MHLFGQTFSHFSEGGNVWCRRSGAIQPMEERLSLHWDIIISVFVLLDAQRKRYFCFTFKTACGFKRVLTGCFSCGAELFSLNVWDWITMSAPLPRRHSSQLLSFFFLCIWFMKLFMCFICTKTVFGGGCGLIFKCFIWAHVHCIVCFTEINFSFTVVPLFPISCLPLTLTPEAFVIQNLSCEFTL